MRAADMLPATAEDKRLRRRRAVVLAVNLTSWVGLGLIMARIIGGAGWSWEGAVILTLFLLGLPWTLLAFWNSLIGFVILRGTPDAAMYTNPALRATPMDAPITTRTAICLAIRHENVARVAKNLAAKEKSGSQAP